MNESVKKLSFFLGPSGILLLGILIFPILYSFGLSFFDANGATWFRGEATFLGIGNYVNLFQDGSFLNSVKLLALYIVVTTVLELILALGFALVLDQVIKPPKWIYTLIILPMFVLPVVSGLTFRYLFDPDSGIIGTVFLWASLEPPDFLGDPTLAFVLVVLQDIWRMWPFLFMIILAGLKGIPKDPIEAIKMDGGNFFQSCRFVILPALAPTILVATLLKVIESLKAFTEIYVMTGGGPGESTTILSMYIIKQITDFSAYGFGSAASCLLILVGIGLTITLAAFKRQGARP